MPVQRRRKPREESLFRSIFLPRLWLAALSVGLVAATAGGSAAVERPADAQAIAAAAPGQDAEGSKKALLEEEQALHLRIQLTRQQMVRLEKSVHELEQLAAEAQRAMRLTSAAAFRETANQHREEVRSLQAQISRMQQRLVEIEQIVRPVTPPLPTKAQAEGPVASGPQNEVVKIIIVSANALRAINEKAAIRDHLETLRKQKEQFGGARDWLRKLPSPWPR
jgi:hypothetical protein